MKITITFENDEINDLRLLELLGVAPEAEEPEEVEEPEAPEEEEETPPKKKAAKKKAAKKPSDSKGGDKERLKNVFQQLIQDGQRDKAVELLNSVGAKRVHEVEDGDVEDLIQQAEACLI